MSYFTKYFYLSSNLIKLYKDSKIIIMPIICRQANVLFFVNQVELNVKIRSYHHRINCRILEYILAARAGSDINHKFLYGWVLICKLNIFYKMKAESSADKIFGHSPAF